MKVWKGFAVAMVCTLTAAFAAYGISLCSYRQPSTVLMDADATFSYQYFDNANTPLIDASSGQIGLNFSRLRYEPDYGFTARLNAQVGLVDFLPSHWLGDAATNFRYYMLDETPVFGFGGLRGIAATGQTQIGIELESGFGFGRFHDVSPLAKAMMIHRYLRVSKAIRATLPDSVLVSIADSIAGLGGSGTTESVLTSIETAVETATSVQLDARALLMIEDVILESGVQRYCGFSAQAGVGYELLDPYGGGQGFIFVASSDMAYAPDASGQMQGHISFSGPVNLSEENTLTGLFSYEILLTESSSLDTTYSVQRIKPAGLDAVVSHSLTCDLVFSIAAVDVLVGASFSRATGDAGWSIGMSVSAALDLF